MMRLCRMHQKWMTQPHSSRRSRGGNLRHPGGHIRGCKSQFHRRDAMVSRCRQQPGNPQMRCQSDSGRRVVLADVRKQKQHEQGSPFRSQIDAPIEVRPRRLDQSIWRKTRVHMPPCVSRVVGVREPDSESSETRSRNPSAHPHQVVERGMQRRRIRRPAKRLLCEIPEPDNRTSPGLSIFRIAANLAPENFARLGRGLSREGILQLHEPITNELLSLCITQHATAISLPACRKVSYRPAFFRVLALTKRCAPVTRSRRASAWTRDSRTRTHG
jgi:hypothetical protein